MSMNTREEYAEHVVNDWIRAGWLAPAPAPWHITPLLIEALTAQAEATMDKTNEGLRWLGITDVIRAQVASTVLDAAPQIPEDADEHS